MAESARETKFNTTSFTEAKNNEARDLYYRLLVSTFVKQGRQVLCMGRLNPSFNRLISARRKTFPAAKKRRKVDEY